MNQWEWSLLEDKEQVDHVMIGGAEVRTGCRVRLHPHEGGDILDLALRGQIATVESIEQDYEGQQHICVVLEDDPGRDLGMMRQPGHRFFFKVTEVEPLPEEEQGDKKDALQPRILIAGIGNIFLGDDGFGVEVVRRLAGCRLPKEVRVVDFGIRGFDLVYALQDRYETTILIDAYPHGQAPGTVSVVELDPNETVEPSGNFLEPHSMHPMNVLRMASAMHGPLKRVLLVGCEPATLGGDEGYVGLSQPVEVAVEQAVKTAETLVKRILESEPV
ncbi:hydrogenase maturation protease [Tunturiibacter gelidiferens]|uniref:hydrogenase maturation protease n=1 Tax=Tunturiibacter gelidiferens TaxID=3069689 RepID=UPI003D9BE67F